MGSHLKDKKKKNIKKNKNTNRRKSFEEDDDDDDDDDFIVEESQADSAGKKKSASNKSAANASEDNDDTLYSKNEEDSSRKSFAEYDIDVQLKENEVPNLILYKYRWVVLFSFFLSSLSIGTVFGSLNVAIMDKIGDDTTPEMGMSDLITVKYSELVLYFPMNFLSIYLIEKHGLRACIGLGCILMILGSCLRMMVPMMKIEDKNIWWWYYGHIICLMSSSLLKTPVTKLASNWFGDKERGIATAIGIISIPCGIFVSKIMMTAMFEDKDKLDDDEGGNLYDDTL